MSRSTKKPRFDLLPGLMNRIIRSNSFLIDGKLAILNGQHFKGLKCQPRMILRAEPLAPHTQADDRDPQFLLHTTVLNFLLFSLGRLQSDRNDAAVKPGKNQLESRWGRAYSNYIMKLLNLKLTRIDNSKGIRLPADLIKRYGFSGTLAAEVRDEGLLLKPKEQSRLTWEETYSQMAAVEEDWSHWESLPDGWVEPWDGPSEKEWLRLHSSEILSIL